MYNLLTPVNQAAISKTLGNGLSYYSQTNCTITLTDNGVRIYRPPNLIYDESTMHNMWGGLKIHNSTVSTMHEYNSQTDNLFGLIQGHTYVVSMHIKGQSTNAATSIGWTNQMGWSGGGLNPIPTNVEYKWQTTNFNGEDNIWYKFTASDAIYKTCTTSYSYATAGKNYMSYYHFMFGYGYENTGSLGTDVYITNIKMFDITNLQPTKLFKNGVLQTSDLSNYSSGISLTKYCEVFANDFIEL